MKIESEDKKSFIQVEFVESELEYLPSFSVMVHVNNEGFCGSNQVWLELDQYKQFIDDLKIIDQKRSGSALFDSISPGEFKVRIKSYDASGHMILEYQIMKKTPRPKHILFLVSGGFELDPDCFTAIVKEFEGLYQACLN